MQSCKTPHALIIHIFLRFHFFSFFFFFSSRRRHTRLVSDWSSDVCSSDLTTAGIGCLECKQPVIEAIQAELAPMRERAQAYVDDPTLVKNIVADGCDKAKRLAAETMRDVREAMGLSYT